jgi:hypothetical protein
MILPCSVKAGRLVCQVICQLMGTVSAELRFRRECRGGGAGVRRRKRRLSRRALPGSGSEHDRVAPRDALQSALQLSPGPATLTVPALPSFRPTIVAVDKLADTHEEPSGADHYREAFTGV